jgi:NADPH:quinone reductase
MTQTTNYEMKIITVEGGSGPAEALKLASAPVPIPNDGEVLIRVRAAGINRPDVFQRLGYYPPPPGVTDTLGLEVAGEVVHAAGRWREGDRVCALLAGGGYAEYATCDARHALPVPEGMTFEEAAGLPETIFTVWANVFDGDGLKAGETLMVHGATSGIGVTAIQMANAAGAKVIATARSAEKAAAARALGASLVVDTTSEDFAEVAKREGGVDFVLSMVGGEFATRDLAALKPGGCIAFIAALGGDAVTLSVLQIMQKNARITGSTMRGRDATEKARLAADIEKTVWPWIAAGKVRATVDRVFPLAEAAAAHAHLEAGAHIGKIILKIN